MANVFVQSFTHLKDKPRADRALHILQRVASLVKPIMRKHSWTLPVLSEFFPDNPNLLGLNVNMGQKILVRLRPPYSPDTFLLEDDVVQTMLHELTHNVHGPHDEKFYKYLSGLQEEYDALQRSGYAGEGFFSEGHRLGASHNVPPHMARLKALEAVEKRIQTSRVLGQGGKLGGLANCVGLSPRELAARAAERRLKDEKSCTSGADAEREIAKAATDSVHKTVIDLTMDTEDHTHGSGSDSDIIIVKDVHPNPKGKSKAPSRSGNTLNGPTAVGTSSSRASTKRLPSKSAQRSSTTASVERPNLSLKAPSISSTAEWACAVCTLLNPAHALECEACHVRKPVDEREGWLCLTCGESRIPHDFWSCSFCGMVKLVS